MPSIAASKQQWFLMAMNKTLGKLGPRSQEALRRVGIKTDGELRALGSVAAFLRVKRSGGCGSLNLLWGIEAALTGKPWRVVAKEDRLSLLYRLEELERAIESGETKVGGWIT